jgi:hypothetical protein
MGEMVAKTSTDLVVMPTGEIVALDDPEQCARALSEIDDLKLRIRELEARLRETLLEESVRVGSKTLHFPGGMTAKIATPTDISWDHTVLWELVEAGLPEDRFNMLVQEEVSYKVNQSIVRELCGANTRYEEIIERAKTRTPRSASVRVIRRVLQETTDEKEWIA